MKTPRVATKEQEYIINSLGQLFSPMPRKKKTPRPKRKREPSPEPEPRSHTPKSSPPPGLGYGAISETPVRQRKSPKLATARFWNEKAILLESPSKPRQSPRFPSSSSTPAVLSTSPSPYKPRTPKTGALPLSNDAIADILRKTKPDCPHAQAWIQAHEISKTEHTRTLAQIEDRMDLRKKIASRLRTKARTAAKESGATKGEIDEFLLEQTLNETDSNSDFTIERIENRVSEACERLQQTMAEIKEYKSKRGGFV